MSEKLLQLSREIALANTEDLLDFYKTAMNKMDSEMISEYSKVVFDLTEKLEYFLHTGVWFK